MRKWKNRILACFLALVLLLGSTAPAAAALSMSAKESTAGLQLQGAAPAGTLLSLVVSESANGNRVYLDQVRSDRHGSFAITIPLAAGNYEISLAGGGEAVTATASAEGGSGNQSNPPSGGGSTGQSAMLVYCRVVGDSIRGTILPRTARSYARGQGKTALDLLRDCLGAESIPYEITGAGYVRSIGGLKEMDRGPLSGWMYRVNGTFPPVAAASYVLQDRDFVEFVYTCDGGKDVGDPAAAGVYGSAIQDLQQPAVKNDKKKETAEFKEKQTGAPEPSGVNWAEEASNELQKRGILVGRTQGLALSAKLTRAELAAMLARAGAFAREEGDEPFFADVPPGSWFYEDVQGAALAGAVTGFPDGTFRPGAFVTRYQAALILRNLGDRQGKQELSCADFEQVPTWARPGVEYVLRCGLMRGYPSGRFGGERVLTRAEAAVLIWQYLLTAQDNGSGEPSAGSGTAG